MQPQQPYQPQNQNPNPQQPYQPVPPTQGQPPISQPQYGQKLNNYEYDFITNPNTAAPKVSLFGGLPKNIVLILAILGVFLVIGVIALLFTGGGDKNTLALQNIVLQQSEIVRISTIASQQQTASQKTANLAFTSKLAVTTDNAQLVELLANNGIETDKKVLEASANAKNTAALEQATTSGDFDSVYLMIAQAQLTKYTTDMKAAYAASDSAGVKALLETQYSNAEALQKLSQQP